MILHRHFFSNIAIALVAFLVLSACSRNSDSAEEGGITIYYVGTSTEEDVNWDSGQTSDLDDTVYLGIGADGNTEVTDIRTAASDACGSVITGTSDVTGRICGGEGDNDTIIIVGGTKIDGDVINRSATEIREFEILELRNFTTKINNLPLGVPGTTQAFGNASGAYELSRDIRDVTIVDSPWGGLTGDGKDNVLIVKVNSNITADLAGGTIAGGAGDDTIEIINEGTHVQDSGQIKGDAGNDIIRLTKARATTIEGGAGNDVIILSGTTTMSYVDGGGGDDTIIIGQNSDGDSVTTAITLNGTSGCDGAAKRICGGAGDDRLIVATTGVSYAATNGGPSNRSLEALTSEFEYCGEAAAAKQASGSCATAAPASASLSSVDNLIIADDLKLGNALAPALQDLTRGLTAKMPTKNYWADKYSLSGTKQGAMRSPYAQGLVAEAEYNYDTQISRAGVRSSNMGFSTHLVEGEISSGHEVYAVLGYGAGVSLNAEAGRWQTQLTASGTRFEVEKEASHINNGTAAIAGGMQYLIAAEAYGSFEVGALELRPHAAAFWQKTGLNGAFGFTASPALSAEVGVDLMLESGRVSAAFVYDNDSAVARTGVQSYEAEPAVELSWRQDWVKREGGLSLASEVDYRYGLDFGRSDVSASVKAGLEF